MCDYYWTANEKRIALVGGNWGDVSNAGLWYWCIDWTGVGAGTTVGARLLKTS